MSCKKNSLKIEGNLEFELPIELDNAAAAAAAAAVVEIPCLTCANSNKNAH